ncbi:MAG: G:T/U mismatch-specific uracil/thymine DNA-glycosylase [uncultured Sphingomonas sp.]|uniref:G:T/U mismatch-specific uracil/thymine DNA-glycosylase n=1 Tax=uncultured Sphingomonas sp. TaxID=158754 RepID=A0A6J4TK70_9SPHN|nr:DNA-deoxyinosine glycosylase [uncultured Sphingomonas sp.]CAA9524176.1 MAG: G:T/U mismatch-specific uracil/thymine DNA-glycosylase [uncultured Sphingomonas sp.]
MGSSVAKSCLPPVVDAGVRLLILGSLPGEASLAAERYYAHPRNQFWRLLETVLAEPLEALPYPARLERLLSRGVGLWDTVATAERTGSLDGAMRAIAANPLPALVETLPELRAVAFNGGTAARIGRRELGKTALTLVDLPSSSPALTLPFAAKAERWAALKPFAIDSG